MNRNEIDKVYLNHLRTNKVRVAITTDEPISQDGDGIYFGTIVAFTPSMLIVSMEMMDSSEETQCAFFCSHIVSIVPMENVSIIFDTQKGA